MTTRKYQIRSTPKVENPELSGFLDEVKRVAEDVRSRVAALEAAALLPAKNHQTISSGQFRPDPEVSAVHYAVNNGAHTLLPPEQNCSIVVGYLNGASAGTVTTSGFTHVDGTPNTTAGNVWFAKITVIFGRSLLEWVALQ